MSCCVRLQALERVLYFIPKETLSRKTDPQLESLEKSVEGDARCKLDSYLETKMRNLREEVTAVLKSRGVKLIHKMKIVQRNYAFDYPAIPHDLQYVLKVGGLLA